MITPSAATPAALLDAAPAGAHEAPPELWGFGGMHGGLVLGMLTRAMAEAAGGAPVRAVTGHFQRPVRQRFSIAAAIDRQGSTMTTASAAAGDSKGALVTARAVLVPDRRTPGHPVLAPSMPQVPPVDDCEPFSLPREFVPFAVHTELRPADTNRPLAGNSVPQLTAWLRLAEDDRPPTAPRLVMLMDSLAPSVMAIHTELAVVPTVEFALTFADRPPHEPSPWILLRAVTTSVTAGGWVDERLDAWSPDGTHLATARQLRVVIGAPG